MNTRPKTIFTDLDGTLVKHCGDVILLSNPDYKLEVLPGTLEKIREWDAKSYWIVIATGRKESLRYSTECQLRTAGIVYNQLIMGFGGGDRILINDKKPTGEDAAFSINISRDVGIGDIDV